MKWEYRTIKFDVVRFWGGPKVDEAAFDVELNRLGAEGWELVSAFDTNWGHGSSYHVVVLFKRPVAA